MPMAEEDAGAPPADAEAVEVGAEVGDDDVATPATTSSLWQRYVAAEARLWERLAGWSDRLALWQVVLLVGLPLLTYQLTAPMQSRFEPVDTGRTLVQVGWLLEWPTRQCIQPAWAESVWPGGYHSTYCGLYWSGDPGLQVAAIPFVLLFGDHPISLRIAAILLTLSTAWLVGRAVSHAWGPRSGRLVAALWLSSPMVAYYGWHYHAVLWSLVLALLLIAASHRGVEGRGWWPAAAVLAIGLQFGHLFNVGAMIVAVLLVATRRSTGGWHWRPAAAMAAAIAVWQIVPSRLAAWAYDGRRSASTSAANRRTTFDMLTDGVMWQEIGVHLEFVGAVSLLALLAAVALVAIRARSFGWRAGVDWSDPAIRLAIIGTTTAGMSLAWLALFMQAVFIHEWFLMALTIPAALGMVAMLRHDTIRPLRMPLLVLLIMLNGAQLVDRWEHPGRHWSPGWQAWMAGNTAEHDVVLAHRDLLDLDASLMWASPAELVMFSAAATDDDLLDLADAHPEVTMIIIPWHEETRLDLRPQLEQRGWDREVVRQYMGGHSSWIVWHR